MAYGGETRRPYSVDFKSLSAAPSNPTNGSMYYDNGTGANVEGLYVYDGSTWQKCDVDTLGALTNVSIGSATETDVIALSGSTWVPSGISSTVDVLSNVATDVLIGRESVGSGDSEELTPARARTLLNVEDGSTADQTDAEIRSAVEAATDSNVFTDADHTKLNAIEALADVTDEANVDAAGAPIITSQAGAPGTTPSKVGLVNINTTSDLVYISTGTASSADWTLLNDGTLPALSLGDLDDVKTTGATETDVIALSGSSWVPSGVTGGSASLSGLTDTTITAPASGAYLKYDGSAWINATSSTTTSGYVWKMISSSGITAATAHILVDDFESYDAKEFKVIIRGHDGSSDHYLYMTALTTGGTEKTGASDYRWGCGGQGSTSEVYQTDVAHTDIRLTPDTAVKIDDVANGQTYFEIRFHNPEDTSEAAQFSMHGQGLREGASSFSEFTAVGSFNGTPFEVGGLKIYPSAGTLNASGDVELWALVDQQALVFDASPTTLSDLTDTSLSSPTSGQILEYNGTNWVNATNAGGGGGGGGPTYSEDVISSGDASYIWDVSDTGLLDAELKLIDCAPTTDGRRLKMSISIDGGSTYRSGSTDYSFQRTELAGTSRNDFSDSTTTQPQLMNAGAGNATNEGLTFTFNLTNPESTTVRKIVEFHGSWIDLIGGLNKSHGHVSLGLTASAVTHVKLFWDSGNFKQGTALLKKRF